MLQSLRFEIAKPSKNTSAKRCNFLKEGSLIYQQTLEIMHHLKISTIPSVVSLQNIVYSKLVFYDGKLS